MVSEWSLLSCSQTAAFSCCMYFDVAGDRAGSQSVIACWCCCRQGHRLHGYHCVFCTWLMARPISCRLSLKACSLTVCSLMVCCQTTVSMHSVLTSLLTRLCPMYVLLTYLLCSVSCRTAVSVCLVTLMSKWLDVLNGFHHIVAPSFSALTLFGWQEGCVSCKDLLCHNFFHHPHLGDGEGGHWLVWMEWRPAGWSVCLLLLIFPCTIKSRSSLLAPAHLGGPGKKGP